MAGKNTSIVAPPYGPIGAVDSPKVAKSVDNITSYLCGNLQPSGFSLTASKAN